MPQRPKLTLALTTTDKILEGLGWISILGSWCLVAINYTELPALIPIHYDATGHADGFGEKSSLLRLPVIPTILFVALTLLNAYPHLFNYPTPVTPENAFKQYTLATRLIRYLKLSIVLIFGVIIYKTIQYAHGQSEGLGIWFLPLIMSVILIPLLVFIVKASRVKT